MMDWSWFGLDIALPAQKQKTRIVDAGFSDRSAGYFLPSRRPASAAHDYSHAHYCGGSN
jgi:hypothetical protein